MEERDRQCGTGEETPIISPCARLGKNDVALEPQHIPTHSFVTIAVSKRQMQPETSDQNDGNLYAQIAIENLGVRNACITLSHHPSRARVRNNMVSLNGFSIWAWPWPVATLGDSVP